MCLESIKNDQETSVAGMKEVTKGFGVDNVREVREGQILRAFKAILMYPEFKNSNLGSSPSTAVCL